MIPPTEPADEIVRVAARAHERDRYLAALLAPTERRAALLAVAAFAGEISRIPATVAEPTLAAIRLQWWRDGLAAASDPGQRTGHPVADAVHEAARVHRLPPALLHGLIDAHEATLSGEPPADDRALDTHLLATEGALIELALRILGGSPAVEADRAAIRHAAAALGRVRAMVELPALTSEGRTLLPADRLAGAGIVLDALYAGAPGPGLVPLLADLAAEARRHLSAARIALAHVSRVQCVAYLPLALLEPQLRALGRVGRDPLRELAELVPLTRVVRLAWAYATGRL